MAIHGREELERENRLIRANIVASLMSDAKWRKLLSALDRPDLKLGRCHIKFVGVPDEKLVRRPTRLYLPRPWIDMVEFGPTPLRSIEWLLFPRLVEDKPGKFMRQNVEDAARIVGALGRFPLELSERGLLIVGHIPASRVDP